jgi:broad specificity phosphatase PhoE
MKRELVLVRHGRSTHLNPGWIDNDGFVKWREAYERAGIMSGDTPPPDLVELAVRAGVVAASDLSRAIESAQRLAPGREIVVSPLIREREASVPALRGARLPLIGWALVYGVRWLFRHVTSRAHATEEELQRADEAARWLDALTHENELVVVVTHASFRGMLATALQAMGWSVPVRRRGSAHWSAWTVAKG